MHNIKEYIGKQVRRYTFVYKSEGIYYHVFSLIEPFCDKQLDANMFMPAKGHSVYRQSDEKSKGSEDKVFFYVDIVKLTSNFLAAPNKNLIIDSQLINSESSSYFWPEMKFVNSNDQETKDEYELIPSHHCAAYVEEYIPAEREKLLSLFTKGTSLYKQLQTVSLQELGYDFTKHLQHLGSFVFVNYNPIFSRIEWREDDKKPGIYARVHYRNGNRVPLSFEVEGLNERKEFLFKKEFNNNGCYLSHFALDGAFQFLSIEVKDKNGELLDKIEQMSFVHSIQLSMQIAEKEVNLLKENEDGTKTPISPKPITKYNEEQIVIGEKSESIKNSLWDEEESLYKRLEDNLDFVFLDGDKEPEKQKENRGRGVAYIRRIIDSAHRSCYICDPYFDINAFDAFIWGIGSLGVSVNILSSKEGLNQEQQKKLRQRVALYNEKIKNQISCKVLIGKESRLHDRLIIADDNVWMLGASLNHFGERATTLIRVPKEYKPKMIDTITQWWNNSEIAEDL